jgi:hypothetical protein
MNSPQPTPTPGLSSSTTRVGEFPHCKPYGFLSCISSEEKSSLQKTTPGIEAFEVSLLLREGVLLASAFPLIQSALLPMRLWFFGLGWGLLMSLSAILAFLRRVSNHSYSTVETVMVD